MTLPGAALPRHAVRKRGGEIAPSPGAARETALLLLHCWVLN